MRGFYDFVGHESHGVHLCNKCGWPFPKPHPSARHRRAHKKICGTIEGYKLVDSGETKQGDASDDDHLSDEDRKTPIPKVEEGNTNEKNFAGIGAVSNRSEDEVFADAPAEFPDGGFSQGSLDSLENASSPAIVIDKVSGKDLSPNPSFKDCADTDNIQSSESSRSQMQNPDYMENLAPLSGTMLGCQDHASSSTDVSEQSKNITLHDGMTDCSMLVGQETDAKNKEINLGTTLLDDVVSPIKHADETSEQASKSEKSPNVVSDMVFTDGNVQLEEDVSQGSNKSVSGHGGTETDEKGNPRINMEGNLMDAVISQSEHVNITHDTVLKMEKKDEVTSHVELADEINQGKEVPRGVLASNLAAGDFSLKAEPTESFSDSVDTSQIKVDATQTTDFLNSNEDYDKKGYRESAHVLSVPDDIPIVDHAEIMLEHFKDHKGVHLHQSASSASGEIIKDGENETQDFISESRKLRENVNVSATDVHVLEDSCKHEDWNNSMVKEEVGEGVFQVNAGSDKIWGSDTTEIEKDHKACSPEEQQLNDTCDDLRQGGYSGTVAPVDSEISQKANVVPTDDAAEHEKAETGVCNIAVSDDGRKVGGECSVESMINSVEPASNLSTLHVNPVSGILEEDNAEDHGKGEIEDFDINEVESGERQREENLSTKTNSISELTSNPQENQVLVEGVNDDSLGKLQETGRKHADEVSKIPEDIKEHETCGTGKLQGDCAAEVPQDIKSDNGGGLDFQKTSEGQTKTELPSEGHTKQEPSCPVDVEPTIQILAPVENNNSVESGRASSGVGSYSFQKEAGESLVKHNLDATAVDVFVESSSQTDSLEGNWGSVLSVLSTASDIPTGVDTDVLPSTDSQPSTQAEKANANKPKRASEGQHSDQPDVFEPPSFMTLVEPGASGQTAAASEVQAGNNPERHEASAMQAGWFPSLTQVSNESPGRKKNEEIIAKVTNWNMKQHTPLKNLLSEANVENKPNSPNPKDNPATVIQRDEKVEKDNETSHMKVSSILGHEAPVGEAAMTEAAKEWNSPARYPADIKREKRKVKARPYWVQFVCCSSVN
ncbi:hypothetical protein SLEP1_g37631 [Rubroshorea leprosula]|uniref:C2H2-type domain-containing protein n=1 Tax=Rubroshorea leprosula TaxID=152421 RepID=A0AAV5KVL3_9ROSI|nr:hypothetical protein SLEP1_g37631 [Rubroshorea leprosula]